jgi:hypothetical protein
MVSGFATQATSASHFRPSRLPISASVERSAIGKPQSTGDVGAEDSILGAQVFELEEQALIDQTSHERQQPCPVVVLHHESKR